MLDHFKSKLRKWKSYFVPNHMEQADALILSIYSTGAERQGKRQVLLLLQVTPKQGRNFITEYKNYFAENEMKDLEEGTQVKILIQPGNTTKLQWVQHPSEEFIILEN